MIKKADIIKERDLLLRCVAIMYGDIIELQQQVLADKTTKKITADEWRGKILRLRAKSMKEARET